MLTEQVAGPQLDIGGEKQLPARRGPQPVRSDLQRALIGHLEVADLLDLVAPELHPQRVFLRRWEHVEDSAANREVPALLDQFGAHVSGADQIGHDVAEFESGVARMQLDRHQIAEMWHLWLQQ
jgi:hypothetical protein